MRRRDLTRAGRRWHCRPPAGSAQARSVCPWAGLWRACWIGQEHRHAWIRLRGQILKVGAYVEGVQTVAPQGARRPPGCEVAESARLADPRRQPLARASLNDVDRRADPDSMEPILAQVEGQVPF